MKRIILITLSLIFVLSSSNIYAKKSPVVVPSNSKKTVTVVKSPKTKVVSKVPTKAVTLRYKGVNYYRNGSTYYKLVNSKYVVTPPPFGLRVSIIPAIHTMFVFNRVNYYCAGGVIYQATSDDQFEVVQPMVGMIVPELPEVNVREVSIDGTIYFEFEGILYKQIPTETGLQYKVSGSLND